MRGIERVERKANMKERMPMHSNSQSRRRFLTSAGLALSPAAGLRAASGRGGLCIDCQSHIFIPELVRLMEKRKTFPYAYRKDGQTYVVVGEWHRRLREKHMDVGAKLADMDAAGIDITALSTNDPGPELFGAEGPTAARIINDYLTDVSRQHSGRFLPLIVLPLQDMDAAMDELDRCVNKLGMKGILLYSNLGGKFPDEPQFRPLFAHAEKMNIPILLHPAYPVTYDVTKAYSLTAGLGLMFDTTIALARIILSGILDQYPKLKLVCPHVGGTLPYVIGRLDHQTQVLKRGAENITKPPSEYLRHIYLDAVSPIALAIRYGYDFVGPDRLLYASDHPWVDPKLIAGLIRGLKLPPGDEAKIFGGNAKRLFSL